MRLSLGELWEGEAGVVLFVALGLAAVEPLTVLLHRHLELWAIRVEDSIHVVSLYAHNALVYLQNPEESSPGLLSALRAFGEVSGLCVNPHKTHLLPLGGLPGTDLMLLPDVGLLLAAEGIQYLGIRIAYGKQQFLDLNIGRELEGLQASVRFRRDLQLLLLGRFLVEGPGSRELPDGTRKRKKQERKQRFLVDGPGSRELPDGTGKRKKQERKQRPVTGRHDVAHAQTRLVLALPPVFRLLMHRKPNRDPIRQQRQDFDKLKVR
ncbi:hypothetical protein NDU88_008421 [Pleurodeles waltl]|uniref:Reverse transcriptase domain-containing protein n=1 Tax=Pleurodeles waltl TaxID=8319 RepID=A0AAV7PPQ4_PLEWA|nr:hypothetical protein NDU88_008421 [Pleurodeles waltl]